VEGERKKKGERTSLGNIIEYNNKHTRTRTTVLGIESEGVSRQSFFFSFSFKNQKL
jgi:hypothetical protein